MKNRRGRIEISVKPNKSFAAKRGGQQGGRVRFPRVAENAATGRRYLQRPIKLIYTALFHHFKRFRMGENVRAGVYGGPAISPGGITMIRRGDRRRRQRADTRRLSLL